MKQKIHVILAISLSLTFLCQGQVKTLLKQGNLLVKELSPRTSLLMLQVRFKNEKDMSSAYAEPIAYLENQTNETLAVLKLSLENCCSKEKFLFEELGGLSPEPFWNGSGIASLKGNTISFPGTLVKNDQINSNDKVHVSHFLVHASDGSGTAIIFLNGPLEELKKTYMINLGQVFNWESSKKVIKKQ